MQKARRIGLLCGLLLVLNAMLADAAVKVEQIEYKGWPGSYRLTNGTVELVFVPQIGRVMRYGYSGGPNVLWENATLAGKTTDFSRPVTDWQNYGGDKVWPAPQSVWSWPPDPTFESAPHTVHVLKNGHLVVESQVSQKHHLRFVREIALDARGTGVTIKNTLINLSETPQNWSIWEITQIDDPSEVRLPLNTKGHFESGYSVFEGMAPSPDHLRIVGKELRLTRNPKKNSKVGGDSPLGRIEATVAGLTLRVSAAYQEGKDYPDEGCAYEVYTSDDPNKYVELELLSPIQSLKPNARTTYTTHWQLSPIP